MQQRYLSQASLYRGGQSPPELAWRTLAATLLVGFRPLLASPLAPYHNVVFLIIQINRPQL